MRRILVFLVLFVACAGAQTTYTPAELAGDWSGTLRFGEASYTFDFELRDAGGKLTGALVTGDDERIPFSSVALNGDDLTIQLAQFGGMLHAKLARVALAPPRSGTFPTLRGDYQVPDGKGGRQRFWADAVKNAPKAEQAHAYPDEPEEATEVWGPWQYRATDAAGKQVEAGTMELARGRSERDPAFARLRSPQRPAVVLRGVGSKSPQMPSDAQLEAWAKAGKEPTKADLKTVEGISFDRFDGQQALAVHADMQPDGSLQGEFFVNGEKFSFRATRAK